MVKHLAIVVVLLSSITIACSTCSKGTGAAQESCSQQHSEWVAQALQRMQSVKPGMTRKDLTHRLQDRGRLVHRFAAHVRKQRLSLFQG